MPDSISLAQFESAGMSCHLQQLPGCVPLRWTEQPSFRDWMIMRVTDGDAGRSCQKQCFVFLLHCLLCHTSSAVPLSFPI